MTRQWLGRLARKGGEYAVYSAVAFGLLLLACGLVYGGYLLVVAYQ